MQEDEGSAATATATEPQGESDPNESNSTEMVAKANFLAAAPASVLEEVKTRQAQKAQAQLEQRKSEHILINEKLALSQAKAKAMQEAKEDENRRQKELEAQEINSRIINSRKSTPG